MNQTTNIPQSIIKTCIAYEKFFIQQVQNGIADEKAGRVYGKEDFEQQLNKARNERKKA